jgi:radical SAM protein with 4Fe4S-binding SPASM domain
MVGRLQRAVYPLYQRLEHRAAVLRYLFLEITQRCNLACRHCGSDCGSQGRDDELGPDEWVALLDRLAGELDRRKVVLVITGGEPLCAPGLDRILQALARHGFAWGMVSNGWALDEQALAGLLAHGLQSLTLSLDGLAAEHDWLRGRAGAFERVVSAIRLAAAAQIPFFDVVTCVHPRNLAQLSSLRTLLVGLGVPAWRLFSIFPRGRARRNHEVRLSDDELCRLLEWIAQERERNDGLRPLPRWSCEGYLPRDLDRQVRDEPYFCRAGINIASVLCDGSISACPNLPRTLVQGNVRRDRLVETWEKRFAPFRDRAWMATGRCGGCADWKRCQGNSLHLWDEQTGATALCHRDVLRRTTVPE